MRSKARDAAIEVFEIFCYIWSALFWAAAALLCVVIPVAVIVAIVLGILRIT